MRHPVPAWLLFVAPYFAHPLSAISNVFCVAWADPGLDVAFAYRSSVQPGTDEGIRHLGEVSDAVRPASS
jgi:hypothetical protein